jgi:hypothetical protein
MNLRTSIYCVILFLGVECSTKPAANAGLSLNRTEIDSLAKIHGDNLAIISCLRCQCFDASYNKAYMNSRQSPGRYVLFADTSCAKLLFPVRYMSKELQERISDDIYNVIFIKRRSGEISTRILSVKESNAIDKIARAFFE